MDLNIKASDTSPQFLHANSTSHIWVFSAIAELIDNAYDPDVHASHLYIDRKFIWSGGDKETCLVFTDNGFGMVPEKLHKMLSFGYCEKFEVRGHKPVGHYGNGFKSGSMRLGSDALVFTKRPDAFSLGFLSQTFLKKIKAETVLVPLVTFDAKTKQLRDREQSKGNLEAILKYSIFTSEEMLLEEFQSLDGYRYGTRIIIYNLKRVTDGRFELDFESDPTDILKPETHELDSSSAVRLTREYTPKYRTSLREYCSILYLKPRMQIYIRGQKVKTKLISKSLSQTERDVYKPSYLPKAMSITFGFTASSQDYGIMMYHRNRLIKAYERVSCQRANDGRGVGVVGIVQLDFLEPIHNKQDFNKTDRYNTCLSALNQKLLDYWCTKTQLQKPDGAQEDNSRPDWTWVQCDRDQCLKWRRIVDSTRLEDLPEKWFCYMNSDPLHNRCDIEEEPEDEDELFKATYKKTRTQSSNSMPRTLAATRDVQIVQVQPPPMVIHDNTLQRKLHEMQQQLEEARRLREEQAKVIRNLQLQSAQQSQQTHNQTRAQQLPGVNHQALNNRAATSGVSRASVAPGQRHKAAHRAKNHRDEGQHKNKRAAFPPPVITNKRSQPSPAPHTSKKMKTVVQCDITSSESSGTEEDCVIVGSEDLRRQRRGKMPLIQLGPAFSLADDDVKPDVEELDRQMEQGSDGSNKGSREQSPARLVGTVSSISPQERRAQGRSTPTLDPQPSHTGSEVADGQAGRVGEERRRSESVQDPDRLGGGGDTSGSMRRKSPSPGHQVVNSTCSLSHQVAGSNPTPRTSPSPAGESLLHVRSLSDSQGFVPMVEAPSPHSNTGADDSPGSGAHPLTLMTLTDASRTSLPPGVPSTSSVGAKQHVESLGPARKRSRTPSPSPARKQSRTPSPSPAAAVSCSEKCQEEKQELQNRIKSLLMEKQILQEKLKSESADKTEFQTKLESLREAVRDLLKFMLPDVQITQLDYMDDIIREVVRKNIELEDEDAASSVTEPNTTATESNTTTTVSAPR